MKYKVYNTPVITPIIRAISKTILFLLGWRVVGRIPPHMKRCVAIAAPHTSNWDFFIFLFTTFSLEIKGTWIGKHTLFEYSGLRWLPIWLGGIPVDRRVRGDMVARTVEMLRGSQECVLGIAPEGTRKANANWRTGFWYIAQSANVPIVLAFIDYPSKRCGIYGEFHSTGHITADLSRIKEFYSRHCVGKHPKNFAV